MNKNTKKLFVQILSFVCQAWYPDISATTGDFDLRERLVMDKKTEQLIRVQEYNIHQAKFGIENRNYTFRGHKKFGFLFLMLGFFVAISEASSSAIINEDRKCSYHMCSVISQDDFLKDFTNNGMIGSGGESSVYKVTDKKTELSYALVLKNQFSNINYTNRKIDFIEQLIRVQEYNIHQAKIFGYFWIENRNYPFVGHKKVGVLPFLDLKEGRILNDIYANDSEAITYVHEATLMELGLGSLDYKMFSDLNFDPVLQNLMRILGDHGLGEGQLYMNDDKDRNYIFVETATQTYEGEYINTYDFLSYTVGFHKLYVSTPSYIIKRIDFDGNLIGPRATCLSLEKFAEYCDITLDEFNSRFCQPPKEPNARILHIKSWKNSNSSAVIIS